jgi:hypothetical protein
MAADNSELAASDQQRPRAFNKQPDAQVHSDPASGEKP